MQSERDFIVLDGVYVLLFFRPLQRKLCKSRMLTCVRHSMVAIAVLALTIFHPGYCMEEQLRELSKDHRGSDSDLESANKLAAVRA